MADRESTEINSKLLWIVRELAAEQGRSESEVLEDAVQFFLYVSDYFEHKAPEYWRSDSLVELFGRIDRWQQEQRVEPLPDDEALRLANKELHAYRRERTGR